MQNYAVFEKISGLLAIEKMILKMDSKINQIQLSKGQFGIYKSLSGF